MTVQKTLSLIKPDAVERNLTGVINARFEQEGMRIIAQKRVHITYNQAERFYEAHSKLNFFKDLCLFMSSGPLLAQVLEGEDVVRKNRELMGATNPANADEGTIRKDFGESIERNAVHGSDSLESAAQEISFFFSHLEILD